MSKITNAQVTLLKGFFDAGDQPTSAQFGDAIEALQEANDEHDHCGVAAGDGLQALGSTAGPLTVTIANNGLHVLDTGNDHDLIITPGTNLSADRILTLITGDAARTITLNGNPTLNDWFDQAVKQASTPTFAGLSIVTGAGTAPLQFTCAGTQAGILLHDSVSGNIRAHVAYDEAASLLKLHCGVNIGGAMTAYRMAISQIGYVTKPNNCSFSVQPTVDQNNWAIGADAQVAFGTEIFDVGSNFGGNTFSAPVTGKYMLSVVLYLSNIDSAATIYRLRIVTTARTYTYVIDAAMFDQDGTISMPFTVVADMTAADTAQITLKQTGGAPQMDIIAAHSYFMGYLLG